MRSCRADQGPDPLGKGCYRALVEIEQGESTEEDYYGSSEIKHEQNDTEEEIHQDSAAPWETHLIFLGQVCAMLDT
jgi:hypothetical protein